MCTPPSVIPPTAFKQIHVLCSHLWPYCPEKKLQMLKLYVAFTLPSNDLMQKPKFRTERNRPPRHLSRLRHLNSSWKDMHWILILFTWVIQSETKAAMTFIKPLSMILECQSNVFIKKKKREREREWETYCISQRR